MTASPGRRSTTLRLSRCMLRAQQLSEQVVANLEKALPLTGLDRIARPGEVHGNNFADRRRSRGEQCDAVGEVDGFVDIVGHQQHRQALLRCNLEQQVVTDVGVFALDDWRFKPNLTLSYGLRYEAQTNISDFGNISPRLEAAALAERVRFRVIEG